MNQSKIIIIISKIRVFVKARGYSGTSFLFFFFTQAHVHLMSNYQKTAQHFHAHTLWCLWLHQGSSTWSHTAGISSRMPAWGDARAHEQVRATNNRKGTGGKKYIYVCIYTNNNNNKAPATKQKRTLTETCLTLCPSASPHSKQNA